MNVADYGIGSLCRQVFDQENAFEDVRQFAEHGFQSGPDLRQLFGDYRIFRLPVVPFGDGFKLFFIGRISCSRRFGCPDQLVRNASECRYDYDNVI